jgi:crotonobetainyl-CoA:carnitine CoA-transferase CaiB-like acyl-CoA transferase
MRMIAIVVKGPLNGVRILDLTHVWAGPLATRTLSDLGADTVKIERSYGRGPAQVSVSPIAGWIGGEPGPEPWNAQATFVKLARNARSVCLDLKHNHGREVFLRLVAVADVVIENFSARAMPALDLGFEALKQANPKIIYVTMPGYGAHGPYRDWVAFGPTVEAMSGLTNVMGYSAQEPRNTAMAVMDPIAGVAATGAVVTALRQRDETQDAQLVEMSLHEVRSLADRSSTWKRC